MTLATIAAEVRGLIESRLSEKLPTRKGWIVAELWRRHPNVEASQDYLDLARMGLESLTEDAMRCFYGVPTIENIEELRVLLTPGESFACSQGLQRGYLVEREGESSVVPIDFLEPAERKAIAEELDRFGRECIAESVLQEAYANTQSE